MRTADTNDPDVVLIWSALHEVYAGYLTGDPTRGDAHLHPDVTLWDSAVEPLVVGHRGLAGLRASRAVPADGPSVVDLVAADPLVDLLGDTALLRHRLTVRSSTGPDESVRVTSVWRREEGRWLLLHHHEDVVV